ncbi:hypothetical protein A8L45_08015 [Veronia pacifica]|uniref:Uncharacterized protein n=2 Tax=Veronia pacifica TaxID=1080227 RepID=A0A1C3EL74_9GAMM|nr:hypothetical protein A8L45_08015 [Veronia pacifica]
MNAHCIITNDINHFLLLQKQEDEKASTIDTLTGDISKDLLAGNHVHVGKDDWHFDDVLSKAFESDDFCMVCEALARTRGDREAFSNLSEEYQALIAEAAEDIAFKLATTLVEDRQHDRM